MNNYTIFTDSVCDIPKDLLKKWGVVCIPMSFRFEDEDRIHRDNDMPNHDFYRLIKAGTNAITISPHLKMYTCAFEKELIKGNDVLHIAFSSGLSTAYGTARNAAEELREKYPERKIIVADSLSASTGYGLLLGFTVHQKMKGATIEQAAQYVIDKRSEICHLFTVNDLKSLKCGGRIDFRGSSVGMKPIMHIDNKGEIEYISKTRGRKSALNVLADQYSKLASKHDCGTVLIAHSDCSEDAEALSEILKKRYKTVPQAILNIGTVIGAHSGSGTVALFFVGDKR